MWVKWFCFMMLCFFLRKKNFFKSLLLFEVANISKEVPIELVHRTILSYTDVIIIKLLYQQRKSLTLWGQDLDLATCQVHRHPR